MALVLGKAPKTVKQTVYIQEPTGKLNDTKRRDLVLTVKKLKKSEFDELMKKSPDDFELCAEMIEDISGVMDEEKREIDYTVELLEQLFEYDYIAGPIVEAVVSIGSQRLGRFLNSKN